MLDNQNLVELWDFSRKKTQDLRIGRGRIFFHFNPKLCLSKIIELQKKLGIEKVEELEVAPNSNGDKVACEYQYLWTEKIKSFVTNRIFFINKLFSNNLSMHISEF